MPAQTKFDADFQIEPLSTYGQTVFVVCAIYGDALLEIVRQEVSLGGTLAANAIARNALLEAQRQIEAMKTKFAAN